MGALADIIRRHGPAYTQQFHDRMPPPHRRVLRDLARCRTPEAGGRLWHCPRCGQAHPACHSCGNRHCPTCGGDDARAWLDRQTALQLPVTYFLNIVRGIMTKGVGIPYFQGDVIALAIFGVIVFVISVLAFKGRLD